MACSGLTNMTALLWSKQYSTDSLPGPMRYPRSAGTTAAIPVQSAASPEDFPLIDNRLMVLTLMTLYLWILYRVLPQVMANRKPFDLRPWIIIYNGALLGAYGAGFSIFSYCFPPWRYLLGGSVETELTKVYYMYLHSLVFWARIVDLGVPLVKVLSGKDSWQAFLHGLYTSIVVIFYSIGWRLEPKEPYTLLPAFDGLKTIIRIMYHTITAPGDIFNPYKSLKRTVHWIHAAIGLFGLSLIVFACYGNYTFSRQMYGAIALLEVSELVFHFNHLSTKFRVFF